MGKYTTGEVARGCGVSVHTVQFYDEKEILKPSGLSEGNRRLYSREDFKALQIICLYKKLGLSLEEIKSVKGEERPYGLLLSLLDEHKRRIDDEILAKKRQRREIETVRANIENNQGELIESIRDIGVMMEEKRGLTWVRLLLLFGGCLMGLVEFGTLILWIKTGIWWPFAVGLPIIFLKSGILVAYYYKWISNVCPKCHSRFKAKFWVFFFAPHTPHTPHTPRTRKLRCPVCDYVGYCVDVYDRGETVNREGL